MNRRASLEWNLETLGKLIFSVLMIIAVIYVVYQLVMLFVNGNADYTATRNLNLLATRISNMQSSKTSLTSMILSMPDSYALVGFNGPSDAVNFVGTDLQSDNALWKFKIGTPTWLGGNNAQSSSLPAPSQCHSACLCAFALSNDGTGGADVKSTTFMSIGFRLLTCKQLSGITDVQGKASQLQLNEGIFNMQNPGVRTLVLGIPARGSNYAFALTGTDVADLLVQNNNGVLLLTVNS